MFLIILFSTRSCNLIRHNKIKKCRLLLSHIVQKIRISFGLVKLMMKLHLFIIKMHLKSIAEQQAVLVILEKYMIQYLHLDSILYMLHMEKVVVSMIIMILDYSGLIIYGGKRQC
nr:MAG TPA: hypothetical protein [Caudoviricetes sp.]